MTSPREIISDKETAEMTAAIGGNGRREFAPLLITVIIVCSSTFIVWVFKEPINKFGVDLISHYGQGWADILLFLFTAVSCTPLVLPVWGYALAGVAIGYHVLRLAAIMALGSTLGSFVTYAVGRYFSDNAWIKRRFPNLLKHRWSRGKSKTFVGWMLFLGTASPIPFDALYAVSGAKRFPSLLFILAVLGGRLVRYLYLGIAFKYLGGHF